MSISHHTNNSPTRTPTLTQAMARGEAERLSLSAEVEQQRKTNVELRVRIVRFDAELTNVRETEQLTAQARLLP